MSAVLHAQKVQRPGMQQVMYKACNLQAVVSIDLVGMLRTDCSGETTLALHVPSSS